MVMAMPVDVTTLDVAWAAIEKSYGQSALHKGSDWHDVERISTGSLMLDYATSGGFPLGRWSRTYGNFSSGKSLTCWNVIKNAQTMGLNCAYYNAERQFDRNYVARLGIDIDKLVVVEGSVIEHLGDMLQGLLGSVHVHVIDSLTDCISIHELDKKPEERTMGMRAAAWGTVIRKANAFFDEKDNAIIMIDQLRATFVPNAAPKPPGGMALDFKSSMNLSLTKGAWLYRSKDGGLTDDVKNADKFADMLVPDGVESKARVEKSKVGPPLRPARVRIDFETLNYDLLWELAVFAKKYDIVTTAGSWYTTPNGERAQGAAGLRRLIENDDSLRAVINDRVRSEW